MDLWRRGIIAGPGESQPARRISRGERARGFPRSAPGLGGTLYSTRAVRELMAIALNTLDWWGAYVTRARDERLFDDDDDDDDGVIYWGVFFKNLYDRRRRGRDAPRGRTTLSCARPGFVRIFGITIDLSGIFHTGHLLLSLTHMVFLFWEFRIFVASYMIVWFVVIIF